MRKGLRIQMVVAIAAMMTIAFIYAWGAAGVLATHGGCVPTDRSGGHHNAKCAPDLAITKTGPRTVAFGETATYHVVVANVGTRRVHGNKIHVTDPVITSQDLVFGSVVDGDNDPWLDPGEAWEYVAPGDVALTLTPETCGPIENTAYVAKVKRERSVWNNRSSVKTRVLCAPDLAIAKVAEPSTAKPGDTVTYTVTVTNAGPLPIPFARIAVSDPSLPTLALQGAAPEYLAPGATLTYRGTRVVTTADCGVVTNTATVALVPLEPQPRHWLPGESDLENNTAGASVTVICTPGIGITKQAAAQTYAPGDAIVYTVVVTNTGQTPIPFAEITVTDPSVPGLALVGAAPQSLAPGQALTYRGTRVTSVADCGPVANTATVTVTPQPRAFAPVLTASASVTVAVSGEACRPPAVDAVLSIKKSGPLTIRARKAFTHTIRVANTGPVTAELVVVTDPIPSGMAVLGRPEGATIVKGVVRWELGSLAPGEARTVHVHVRSTFSTAGRRCNIASADAANAAPVSSRLCTRFLQVAGQQFGGVTG